MENTFKVGQIWETRLGQLYKIVEVLTDGTEYPILSVNVKNQSDIIYSTIDGCFWRGGYSDDKDLVKLKEDN